LLYFCISENNFGQLIRIFPKLNLVYFVLALIAMIIYWLCDSVVLFRIFRDKLISFTNFFRITMLGQFYNSITPFNSGGQPAQVMYLTKFKIQAGEAISKLAQKIFVYQICSTTVSSLSIMFFSNQFKNKFSGFTFLTILGLAFQCSGIFLIVLFYLNKKKLMNLSLKLGNLLYKMHIIKNTKLFNQKIEKHMEFLQDENFSFDFDIWMFIYSFVQNIAFYSVPFFIAKSFGLSSFPVFSMIAAQIFITLISSANPLPGAAGTTEGSFLLILSDFFVGHEIAPAMILCRLISYYLNIAVGSIVVFLKKSSNI
jgi:uncharacterized protein (TIRG00374 family)